MLPGTRYIYTGTNYTGTHVYLGTQQKQPPLQVSARVAYRVHSPKVELLLSCGFIFALDMCTSIDFIASGLSAYALKGRARAVAVAFRRQIDGTFLVLSVDSLPGSSSNGFP